MRITSADTNGKKPSFKYLRENLSKDNSRSTELRIRIPIIRLNRLWMRSSTSFHTKYML
ncbi:hypothetical protein DPMN_072720 [Dreissena polymorpha]|uniref:Uncharacterized protein n=1 Tax=Dreissena polymorpha TaxID=45954 RepID=A0A9D4BXT2_DREPO|nr:hypothetical protein DPMN_072720 [Dreissena polymorpha]